MEKTELEKREKELKKVSLYERLYNEVSIEKQKEEIKEKIKTAVATNDFEEMSGLVKVIDNLSKQDNQQQKEIGDLRIREIKKVLSSIISLIPENGIDIIVRGIRFKTKAESKSSQSLLNEVKVSTCKLFITGRKGFKSQSLLNEVKVSTMIMVKC